MEAKWKTAIILSGTFLLGSSFIGFLVQDWGDFSGNILAEIAGFCLAFGVAVLLIEGRAVSWEKRRQAAIAKDAKSILRMSRQYSSLLVTDMANLLSYQLKLDTNVYHVKARDVNEFNALAMEIFDQARCVPDTGLPLNSDFGGDVFGRCVDSIEKFSHSVREFYRGNYDVQTYLSALTDVVEDLDRQITTSIVFPEATDEESRFKAAGELGRVLLRFEEAVTCDYSAIQ